MENVTKPVYVATYGSLRRNMGNHHVNNSAGAELVGLGKTVKSYTLYAYCSGFPSVSTEHPRDQVRVEVYKTTQDGLEGPYDGLEGYPRFYDRKLVPIQMDSGEVIEAWIYCIDREQQLVVEGGDWCLYKAGESYYDTLD